MKHETNFTLRQWSFLKKAVDNKRVPQALIFSGPEGTGKKQTALEFVKLLHQGQIKGQDFIQIIPEGKEIQINQIRYLQEQLAFRPQFADLKTVLIGDAHLMNKLAQNCFLKTLEEPPGKTIFVLLTAFPEILLPTIRSRCAMLKFFLREQPKIEKAEEMKILFNYDLSGKFALAEKMSKDNSKEETVLFLRNLIIYLRNLLLQRLETRDCLEIKEKIEKVEYFRFLISTTNINKRLALENLLLSL